MSVVYTATLNGHEYDFDVRDVYSFSIRGYVDRDDTGRLTLRSVHLRVFKYDRTVDDRWPLATRRVTSPPTVPERTD